MGSMSETMTAARAERLALCDLFEKVGPDAPTLCGTWLTRDLAAHLIVRERRPDLAVGILIPGLGGRLAKAQDELAQTDWRQLIHAVRTGPPFWHPTRVDLVDAAVNTLEFVIHHEDVLRGDGEPQARREVPAFVADATWDALGRIAPLFLRRAGVSVDLKAPGRKIIRGGRGPGVVVTGAPVDLALLIYGRARVADVGYAGAEAAIETLKNANLGV